jgi:hypothetical protein
MLATNQMLILKFTIGINEPEETDQNAKEFQVASPVPSGQAIPMTMAPVQMYNPYGNQVYAGCVCVCCCMGQPVMLSTLKIASQSAQPFKSVDKYFHLHSL